MYGLMRLTLNDMGKNSLCWLSAYSLNIYVQIIYGIYTKRWSVTKICTQYSNRKSTNSALGMQQVSDTMLVANLPCFLLCHLAYTVVGVMLVCVALLKKVYSFSSFASASWNNAAYGGEPP